MSICKRQLASAFSLCHRHASVAFGLLCYFFPKIFKTKWKITPKRNRHQKIIKFRAKINTIDTNKNQKCKRIKETKGWFFEKINRIYKLFSELIKRLREMFQISKNRNQSRVVTKDTEEIQRILRIYFKNLLCWL